MSFNLNGKKILYENGEARQYTLSTQDGRFKCECGCNVFTKFEEMYNGMEIYECNVCHTLWQ